MAEKKYIIDNAELMAEWDWEKNNAIGLDPCKLTIGSHKYAFWICAKHKIKFEQEIRSRVKGERTCPQCYDEWRTSIDRERYIKGKKILAETHPELVEEWISCYDPKFTPYTCVAGSNVKVKWKCKKCGGEYEAYIANRTLRGSSCPFCANQKVLIGYNDLQSQLPDLAAEWSNKNIIKPTEVTKYSKKKVYWVCPLGHDDYLMSVQQRSNRQGCPICAQQSQTSFPEQAIYFYLKQAFPDTINRYIFDGREIDIFIPSKNIGIEYNGYFSHKKKAEKDILKKAFFESVGITLFVVKEYKHTEEKEHADFYIHERTTFNDLTRLINDIIKSLDIDISVDVDCSRDSIAIKNQYVILRRENSIAAVRPDLVERWDYEKNGSITPEMVTLGTGQRFYWKCKICNRSYLALPNKIAEGSVCSKHRNLLKYDGNDLATKHPELLKYWDYEKNDVNPSEIFGGGERVVYWKCEKGHSYTKSIIKHVRGEGCPVCAGKKVLVGFNDLSTVCPDVAKTWNYPKNGDALPTHITAHSNKKFWWICEHRHEWEAKVCNRVNGRGCPYCAGLYVIKGENDLQTINSLLAKEWNHEKNGNLKPEDSTASSGKKVWWKCSKGHEWETTISNRHRGTGCPYCSGNKVLTGYNDLQTLNPVLASEWNYEKNNDLTPADVMSNSGKKVWWKCSKGHEWQATIDSRNRGNGCPICRKTRKESRGCMLLYEEKKNGSEQSNKKLNCSLLCCN